MYTTHLFLLFNLLTGQPAGQGIDDSSFPTITACAAARQAFYEASHRTVSYACRPVMIPAWTQSGTYRQVPPPIIDMPIVRYPQP